MILGLEREREVIYYRLNMLVVSILSETSVLKVSSREHSRLSDVDAYIMLFALVSGLRKTRRNNYAICVDVMQVTSGEIRTSEPRRYAPAARRQYFQPRNKYRNAIASGIRMRQAGIRGARMTHINSPQMRSLHATHLI